MSNRPWVVVVYHDYGGKVYVEHCVPFHTPSAEAMLLGGGVPVAMLGGYLDDSSDDKREQYFSFGGLLGDVRQIDLFNLLWTDATHGLKEPFRSTDDGVPFDPFYLCVKSAISQLAMSSAVNQNIDMWFEEGDHDGQIQSIHKDLKNLKAWRHSQRLLGMTGRDKRFTPLQGADLFAREAFKYFSNEGIRAERKPFIRLRDQLLFHCWKIPALEELKKQGGPDNLNAFAALEIYK